MRNNSASRVFATAMRRFVLTAAAAAALAAAPARAIAPGEAAPAFGCPHCRVWSEAPASALGTELPCPNCGKAVKLNPFVIEADWRPVAAAWKGEIEY